MVFGAMIALFVAVLNQTVVSTAIPRIVADLGGLSLLPWVFTAYMLTSTIAVPIAGKLGDQLGRKPLFLAGLAIFFVSSLGAATREAERLGSVQTLVMGHLEQVRLSVSGVSLDEEMVDLMRFQRAYQAAARIISVIDEMLDTLINRMI